MQTEEALATKEMAVTESNPTEVASIEETEKTVTETAAIEEAATDMAVTETTEAAAETAVVNSVPKVTDTMSCDVDLHVTFDLHLGGHCTFVVKVSDLH